MTIEEYADRICICGEPRANHAYAYGSMDQRGRGVGRPRIIGIVVPCEGFVDEIEQKIGYPRAIIYANTAGHGQDVSDEDADDTRDPGKEN